MSNCLVDNCKREERLRLRKLRLLQVRNQSRDISLEIRKRIKDQKEKQKLIVRGQQEKMFNEWKMKEMNDLQKKYEDALRQVGLAHQAAEEEAIAKKLKDEERVKNDLLAQKRGMVAQTREIENMRANREKESAPIRRKEMTRAVEDIRAGLIVQSRDWNVINRANAGRDILIEEPVSDMSQFTFRPFSGLPHQQKTPRSSPKRKICSPGPQPKKSPRAASTQTYPTSPTVPRLTDNMAELMSSRTDQQSSPEQSSQRHVDFVDENEPFTRRNLFLASGKRTSSTGEGRTRRFSATDVWEFPCRSTKVDQPELPMRLLDIPPSTDTEKFFETEMDTILKRYSNRSEESKKAVLKPLQNNNKPPKMSQARSPLCRNEKKKKAVTKSKKKQEDETRELLKAVDKALDEGRRLQREISGSGLRIDEIPSSSRQRPESTSDTSVVGDSEQSDSEVVVNLVVNVHCPESEPKIDKPVSDKSLERCVKETEHKSCQVELKKVETRSTGTEVGDSLIRNAEEKERIESSHNINRRGNKCSSTRCHCKRTCGTGTEVGESVIRSTHENEGKESSHNIDRCGKKCSSTRCHCKGTCGTRTEVGESVIRNTHENEGIESSHNIDRCGKKGSSTRCHCKQTCGTVTEVGESIIRNTFEKEGKESSHSIDHCGKKSVGKRSSTRCHCKRTCGCPPLPRSSTWTDLSRGNEVAPESEKSWFASVTPIKMAGRQRSVESLSQLSVGGDSLSDGKKENNTDWSSTAYLEPPECESGNSERNQVDPVLDYYIRKLLVLPPDPCITSFCTVCRCQGESFSTSNTSHVPLKTFDGFSEAVQSSAKIPAEEPIRDMNALNVKDKGDTTQSSRQANYEEESERRSKRIDELNQMLVQLRQEQQQIQFSSSSSSSSSVKSSSSSTKSNRCQPASTKSTERFTEIMQLRKQLSTITEVDSQNISKTQIKEPEEIDILEDLLRRKLISKPFDWVNQPSRAIPSDTESLQESFIFDSDNGPRLYLPINADDSSSNGPPDLSITASTAAPPWSSELGPPHLSITGGDMMEGVLNQSDVTGDLNVLNQTDVTGDILASPQLQVERMFADMKVPWIKP